MAINVGSRLKRAWNAFTNGTLPGRTTMAEGAATGLTGYG